MFSCQDFGRVTDKHTVKDFSIRLFTDRSVFRTSLHYSHMVVPVAKKPEIIFSFQKTANLPSCIQDSLKVPFEWKNLRIPPGHICVIQT